VNKMKRSFLLLAGIATGGFLWGQDSSAIRTPIDTTYRNFCANCHGSNMEGGMGGSLIDGNWEHGQTDSHIAAVISDGLPDLGMPSFQGLLNEPEVRAMVIYIRERAAAANQQTIRQARPNYGVFSSQYHQFRLEKITQLEDVLWAIEFLPDGSILLSQKDGPVWLHRDGENHFIEGTPEVWARVQGGMLDVAVHPDYTENGWIYLAFSEAIGFKDHGRTAGMLAIVRGRIRDNQWVDQEYIYRAPGRFHTAAPIHFGTRLAFRNGHLFFSIGDRGQKESALNLRFPFGKIHRIEDDGDIPTDNPFVDIPRAIKSVWSVGNRNPQGLTIHPFTEELWASEHGPRGGDEINLIKRGANYGWPEVTHGMNYNGTPLTHLTEKIGTTSPKYHWTPSIAVCGIDFYTGERFPQWQGNLLASGLVSQQLHRLVIQDGEIIEDEIILKGQGRVRDVKTGPDGMVYISLNTRNPDRGALYRLVPAD